MMLRYIWQRYFFKEILKIFFLFLGCFYFVYVLVDFSTHMQDFIQKEQIQVEQFLMYYGYQFNKRADILLPLALLIASIKVLLTMNTRRELLALQTAGVRTKSLLSPFFILASLTALCTYCNFQFFLPPALNFIDQFHNANFSEKTRRKENANLHSWVLKDGSKVVYQNFDPEKNAYFDVFWIRSAHDIWKIKYLSSDPAKPIGEFVDHLQRTPSGRMEKTESFRYHHFSQLQWGHRMIQKQSVPIENHSISNLVTSLFKEENLTSHKKAEISTHLLYKTLMPLLPLVMVLAVSPFCIRYGRNTPLFLIYTVSIFGYIVFYTFMDAALILGKNQVLSPLWVIVFPMAACASLFYYKFIKHT